MSAFDTTQRFPRARNGYDPSSVEDYLNEINLVNRQLQQEVAALRSKLDQSSAEVVHLRQETAVLAESSPAPQAMTDRIAKMLRVAVDEVSEMQYEARLEAEQMIVSAQAEAEATQAKARQMVADLTARQRAMETEYAEVMNKAREEAGRITAQAVSEAERMRELENVRRAQAEDELNAELTRLRRETEARIEEQIRSTNQECEVRLFDAKTEAERRLRVAGEQIDRRLQEARRALDDLTSKRIGILEQLMQVHGSLESIPSILESAYREYHVSADSGLALTNAAVSDSYGSHSADSSTIIVMSSETDQTVTVEETGGTDDAVDADADTDDSTAEGPKA